MNVFLLSGNMTKPVEAHGGVGSFTLAVDAGIDKDGNRKTHFLYIKVFGKTFENVQKYTGKGSKVNVLGRIEQDTWIDKNGNSQSRVSLLADRVEFLNKVNPQEEAQMGIPTGFNQDDNIPF